MCRVTGDYSFEMYLHAFVLPYYRDRLNLQRPEVQEQVMAPIADLTQAH